MSEPVAFQPIEGRRYESPLLLLSFWGLQHFRPMPPQVVNATSLGPLTWRAGRCIATSCLDALVLDNEGVSIPGDLRRSLGGCAMKPKRFRFGMTAPVTRQVCLRLWIVFFQQRKP